MKMQFTHYKLQQFTLYTQLLACISKQLYLSLPVRFSVWKQLTG